MSEFKNTITEVQLPRTGAWRYVTRLSDDSKDFAVSIYPPKTSPTIEQCQAIQPTLKYREAS